MIPIETDQIEKGLSRLIYELQGKENVEKLTTLFLKQVQDIEDANFSTLQQRGIYEAVGFQLDLIGKIVGLSRKGLDDESYRAALLLKIAVNNADGTPESIIELMGNYTGSSDVRLTEGEIAWGVVNINPTENINNTSFFLLQDIKPSGTRWFLQSDVDNNAFFPSWEIRIAVPELFEIYDGSGTDTLELLFEDGTTSELFVQVSPIDTQYLQASLGREVLEWELSSTFEVFDGTEALPLDVQVNASTSEQLFVEGVGSAVQGDTPFSWEIDETHTGTVTPTVTSI